jgi:exportin-2 (importin alpha re-exporter)
MLETAHSIFRPWRAHVRSDALFSEINFVLSRFIDPFLALFRHTASLIFSSASTAPQNTAGGAEDAQIQSMILLLDIFYDFTCQDLPPAIEDAHDEFFHPGNGWFLRFLGWGAGPSDVSLRLALSSLFLVVFCFVLRGR